MKAIYSLEVIFCQLMFHVIIYLRCVDQNKLLVKMMRFIPRLSNGLLAAAICRLGYVNLMKEIVSTCGVLRFYINTSQCQ